MKLTRPHAWVLCGLAAMAAAAVQAGPVEVKFIGSDRYADIGYRPAEREAQLQVLASHLQALGKRYLPAEQSLKIEVLDVDLAGQLRPTRRGEELRVVRGGADWPSIKLRYTLQGAGGQVLAQGEERVSDMNYTFNIADYGSRDPLRYEKRMLREWFHERFAPGSKY